MFWFGPKVHFERNKDVEISVQVKEIGKILSSKNLKWKSLNFGNNKTYLFYTDRTISHSKNKETFISFWKIIAWTHTHTRRESPGC